MKILQVTGSLSIGGLENVAANFVRYSPNQDEFHFLIYNGLREGYYDEMEELGCTVHHIPRFDLNIFAFLIKLFMLAFREKFDVVHLHTYYSCGYMAPIFKVLGTKKIIIHSHTAGDSQVENHALVKRLYIKIMKKLIMWFGTDFLAVGEMAGESLFDNKFSIIKNGIDLSAYAYNQLSRDRERNNLGIEEDTFVIGHIGRFSPEKNQEFILDLFKDTDLKRKKLVILLIGEGQEYRELLEMKVEKYKLSANVRILSGVKNTSRIINAIDVLVFPSLYEGIPLALIEAQANGLPVIASNGIDPQVNITGKIQFLDLKEDKKKWVDKILHANRFIPHTRDLNEYDVRQIASYISNDIYRSSSR